MKQLQANANKLTSVTFVIIIIYKFYNVSSSVSIVVRLMIIIFVIMLIIAIISFMNDVSSCHLIYQFSILANIVAIQEQVTGRDITEDPAIRTLNRLEGKLNHLTQVYRELAKQVDEMAEATAAPPVESSDITPRPFRGKQKLRKKSSVLTLLKK